MKHRTHTPSPKSLADRMRRLVKSAHPVFAFDADPRRFAVSGRYARFDIAYGEEDGNIVALADLRVVVADLAADLMTYYPHVSNCPTIDFWVDGDREDTPGYDPYRAVILIDLYAD